MWYALSIKSFMVRTIPAWRREQAILQDYPGEPSAAGEYYAYLWQSCLVWGRISDMMAATFSLGN